MPTFEGIVDTEKVEKWLDEVEDSFDLLEVKEKMKPQVSVPFLVWEAFKWWKVVYLIFLMVGSK